MLLDYNLQDNLRLSKVSLTLIPSLQACAKACYVFFSGALSTQPRSLGWDLAATKKLSLLFVRQQCSISSQLFKGSERSFKTRITTETRATFFRDREVSVPFPSRSETNFFFLFKFSFAVWFSTYVSIWIINGARAPSKSCMFTKVLKEIVVDVAT